MNIVHNFYVSIYDDFRKIGRQRASRVGRVGLGQFIVSNETNETNITIFLRS